MTSETPDIDTELVTVLRNKIAETKQVDGEELPISLTAVELTNLLNRLEEAEALTKPQPCSYEHEEPYDFDYCATHDRTFARGGECDQKGQSLVNYLDDMSMNQRGRAVMAEMTIERLNDILDEMRQELHAYTDGKQDATTTADKVSSQLKQYDDFTAQILRRKNS